VTLRGGYERRPDLVLYLNGIAVGVIELKRSSVEIGDGVRQLITNQEEIFNKGFFADGAVGLRGQRFPRPALRHGDHQGGVLCGVEGGRTRAELTAGALLDRPLAEMCEKSRLLDLIRNFIIFDNGIKKVPRPHQFAGVKAAQERIRRREGGVIWHTQGSGKSILMVLLAKWLLEHDPDARILIVTDRDELDKQIEGVMKNAGVIGERLAVAAHPEPGGVCRQARGDRAAAALRPAAQVRSRGPQRPAAAGAWPLLRLCGRVPPHPGRRHEQADEALAGGRDLHRLHRHAAAAKRTREDGRRDIFGTYIHTYKFHEAVVGQGGPRPEIRGPRRAAAAHLAQGHRRLL
jgi:type I restriction enzyme R subunit